MKSEIVFHGGHIQVRVDRVIEPAGHEATREIVVHPGAVCIVARPSDTEVLLIRQYRHATGGEEAEIVRGFEGEAGEGAAVTCDEQRTSSAYAPL